MIFGDNKQHLGGAYEYNGKNICISCEEKHPEIK